MKTTIADLIKTIDRTKLDRKSDPSWEEIAQCMGIENLYWSDDVRLKCYHMHVWYCTDSWVGTRAYFLDDEFVAISMQRARKSDEQFEFVADQVEKLRTYLRSLVDDTPPAYSVVDLTQEYPSLYKVAYVEQLMGQFHHKAIFEGREVKVTAVSWNANYVSFDIVEIEDQGVVKLVPLYTLEFFHNASDYDHRYRNLDIRPDKAAEVFKQYPLQNDNTPNPT